MNADDAYCIGCGSHPREQALRGPRCNDDYGCDVGCSWLRLDRDAHLGVCSECEHRISAWDNGKRGFFPEAEANLLR
ncbi:MAG: hypothetical protein UBAL2_80490432a [Leptospirillum rubarum]|nr:MAG: hypothetical protein UBAL2_80490432a [Leptospirillum rubarum]